MVILNQDRTRQLDESKIDHTVGYIQPTNEFADDDIWNEEKRIVIFIPYTEEELEQQIRDKRSSELKLELVKIKEDIEQEVFGIVRDDYAEKKARAAAIVNELRVLEGKMPREVKSEIRTD